MPARSTKHVRDVQGRASRGLPRDGDVPPCQRAAGVVILSRQGSDTCARNTCAAAMLYWPPPMPPRLSLSDACMPCALRQNPGHTQEDSAPVPPPRPASNGEPNTGVPPLAPHRRVGPPAMARPRQRGCTRGANTTATRTWPRAAVLPCPLCRHHPQSTTTPPRRSTSAATMSKAEAAVVLEGMDPQP